MLDSKLLSAMKRCEGLDLRGIPPEDEVDAVWCLRFLRAIRDLAFATLDEEGLPSVRIIDVMAITPDRLYFLAPRGKAFHADVMREKYVAIVGQTPDYRTCRLRGTVVRPPDDEQHALVDALFELNPGMEIIYPDDKRYICDVFFIADGEGEYFDLGQKPVFRKSFSIGEGGRKTRIYKITDRCIECGSCQKACPEGCISAGSPFFIDQSHCIRCGLCVEKCPTDAIVSK